MKIKLYLIAAGSLCLASELAFADEPKKRHGVVTDRKVLVEGGFTVTAQSANDSRINDEMLTSFDLVAEIPNGPGHWVTYIEGNLSPRLNGVSSVLGEVNGDAGTALDRDGKGRLQVSEFHYSRKFGENSMTIGLINPACVLDSSEVANDETSQFLSASFVNNPTIAFPDYALGSCIHFEEGQTGPGFNLLLTSSHGLADNPNASYSELFDVGADGKGVFLGGEMYWETERSMWRLGVWKSTADADYLDGSGNIGHNYGAYLTTDHRIGDSMINVRLGMANEDVSEAAGFASVALETPLFGNTFGIGIAQTRVSDKLGAGSDDTRQAEIYLRYDVNDSLHVTPSVQWIENSGFDSTGTLYDKSITVYGVRASYLF